MKQANNSTCANPMARLHCNSMHADKQLNRSRTGGDNFRAECRGSCWLWAGVFRSVKDKRERVSGEFHMEGIVVREETARRDLRGYCVWEKSGNGSEMLL